MSDEKLVESDLPADHNYSKRTITPELQACFPEQGTIAAYIRWACQTSYADPYFHLGSILPCAAYELNRRGFVIGEEEAPFRIVMSIIAGSGTAKSTATSRARKFLNDWLKNQLGPLHKNPFLQCIGSPQGVVHSMLDHWDEHTHHTIPVFWIDEVSMLLRQVETADTINQLWDGSDYDRKFRHLQREAINDSQSHVVRAPILMGLFTGTESALEGVVRAEHFGAGLFSRMLWIRGEDRLPKGAYRVRFSSRPKERQSALATWDEWANFLNVMATRELAPRVISIDDSGLDLVEQFMIDDIQEHIGTQIGGIMARLVEYTQTVAAIYAVSQGRFHVEQDDAARAANLIHKCRTSILRLHGTLGSRHEETREAARVADVVRAVGSAGLNRRDLYEHTRLPRRMLDEALAELLDRGVVYVRQYQPPKGGRPGLRYFHESVEGEVQ